MLRDQGGQSAIVVINRARSALSDRYGNANTATNADGW
jgi:hypothetical protein